MMRFGGMTIRQKAVTIFSATFILLLLLINIFLIGGIDFVQGVDAFIPLPLALLTTILLFKLWRDSRKEEVGRKIWGTLLAGLVLWTISEAGWNIYSFLGVDLPFPSPVDFTWVLAYVFFFLGFYLRFRSLQVTLKKRDILYILLIYVPLVILTLAFSIIPIFLEEDQSLGAIGLSILYPILDLVIPLRAMIVFITLRKGTLFRPWAFFGSSFLCFSIADIAFSYAERNDLYWTGGGANFISVFGDWTYIVAYVVMALGVYYVFGASEISPQAETEADTISPSNQPMLKTMLIITDAGGRICGTSPGTLEVISQPGNPYSIGDNISQVLNLDISTVTEIIEKNAVPNMPGRQVITLQTGQLSGKQFKVSMFPSYDARGNFIGADLLMRSVDARLTAGNEAIHPSQEYLPLEDIQEKTVNTDDILAWYFRSQLRVLYILIARMAGASAAGTLLALINKTAEENKWPIEMGKTALEITDLVKGSVDEKATIYRGMLKLVADYAVVIASYASTAREIQLLDHSLDDQVRKIIKLHGLVFPSYSPV
jgi:hypothetical protein